MSLDDAVYTGKLVRWTSLRLNCRYSVNELGLDPFLGIFQGFSPCSEHGDHLSLDFLNARSGEDEPTVYQVGSAAEFRELPA